MRVHRWLVLLAAVALPARLQARYREQWLADLRDCAECDLRPGGVAWGAFRFAVSTSPREGNAMLPIGPLAIVMRHTGGEARRVLVVAVVMLLALLAGIGLLLT